VTFLGDVVARARGLSTSLLTSAQLGALVRASDRTTLSSALEGLGYPWADPESGVTSGVAESIDAAIARGGARRLAVLARWLGPRRSLFVVVFEEEDRRVLRTLLRRAAAGDLPEPRPAALGPTPDLPRRILAGLAGASTLPELVRRLTRSGNAYGPPLARALETSGPDLLALETALDRTFALRARRGASRASAHLRAWVADGIDLENAWHALLGGTDSFVEGGRVLTRAIHDTVLEEPDESARRRRLAEAFAGESLAQVFADATTSVASLEGRALAARIAAERRAARREPIGAAPILEFVLRLRAELADLRRIHWGIAQGVAHDTLLGELVVRP
jgi:vacuolar-type H+-ATPase subunit C/Vma6